VGSDGFKLRRSAPLAHELRRVMADELVRVSNADLATPAAWVHETRKSLKRVRAALRLIRGAVEPEVARCLDERARDLSRRLAPWRDGDALLERALALAGDARGGAFCELLHAVNARRAGPDWTPEMRALRAGVEEEHRALGRDLSELDLAPPLAKHVARSAKRLLERARRGAASAEDGEGAALHAWRKTVKRCGYVAQLLGKTWKRAGAPPARLLDELGEVLGGVNDLSVLRARLLDATDADPAVRDAVDEFVGVLDAERDALLARARVLGKRALAKRRVKVRRALRRAVARRWRKAHLLGDSTGGFSTKASAPSPSASGGSAPESPLSTGTASTLSGSSGVTGASSTGTSTAVPSSPVSATLPGASDASSSKASTSSSASVTPPPPPGESRRGPLRRT
jgi:CHAD domain-containing protein